MSTVGVILSTVGDTQYHRGYHDARGGYHEYRWEKIFCYLSTPMVLNTPTVLMISPTCIMISPMVLHTPHGIAHTLYRVLTYSERL